MTDTSIRYKGAGRFIFRHNQVDTFPIVRPEFRKRRFTLGYELRHSLWEFSRLSSKSGEFRSREWKPAPSAGWNSRRVADKCQPICEPSQGGALDTEMVAYALLGLADQAAFHWLVLKGGAPLDRLIEEQVKFGLYGLLGEGPDG